MQNLAHVPVTLWKIFTRQFWVRKNSESEYGLVAKRNVISGNDYFLASLIVDMKSFIRLYARIDSKYGPF